LTIESTSEQQGNMKPTQALLCALILGATTLVTNAIPAAPVLARLNLSGIITVNTNDIADNGKATTLRPSRRSYNTKDIVNLLNSSTNFNNYLLCYTGTITNLPAKTYFAYDIYGYNIYAVLPDGSTVLMQGTDCSANFFSFLSMDFSQISASYSKNDSTGAGSESDQLSDWWIEIIDYNNPVTDIRIQGQMNLNWSAGPLNNGITRKLTVSDSFIGNGHAEYKGFMGTGTGKASGSGMQPSVISNDWPFWIWWNNRT
jgi:hypothetical protein